MATRIVGDLSKDNIENLYCNQKLSTTEISKIFKCSRDAILKRLHRYKIKIRYCKHDLANKKIRYWKVGTKYKRSKSGHNLIWKTLCTLCNKYFWKNASELIKKKTKCCKKCWGKLRRRYKELSGEAWGSIKHAAETRNLPFNITAIFIIKLLKKQNNKCALSGVSIVLDDDWNKRTASLDRINSNRGYFRDNVHWIHKELQTLKWDKSMTETIDWCEKIYKHQRCNHSFIPH
jgi:predicted DNA-binding protein YlxM (UPF0122 family)